MILAMPKKQQPSIVRPRGSYVLNAQIQVHGDRRTKRERDRSSQNRTAIQRSANES